MSKLILITLNKQPISILFGTPAEAQLRTMVSGATKGSHGITTEQANELTKNWYVEGDFGVLAIQNY